MATWLLTRRLHPIGPSQVMEALMRCRAENPWARYWGVCNDITYELSACLKEEKLEFRAPRQAKYVGCQVVWLCGPLIQWEWRGWGWTTIHAAGICTSIISAAFLLQIPKAVGREACG